MLPVCVVATAAGSYSCEVLVAAPLNTVPVISTFPLLSSVVLRPGAPESPIGLKPVRAATTISVVELLRTPSAAVIVVIPGPITVAKPVGLIVATLVAEEVHVAVSVAVTSCGKLELNTNDSFAENCRFSPF